MHSTTTAARDALLAELLDGENPDSPEYGDARARLEGLLADHRAEVLAEARAMVLAESKARLDAIDEDDLRPSDWERHEQWCAAANVLKRAAKAPAATTEEG